jgi:hypothetical protein
MQPVSGVLVTLVFRVIGDVGEEIPFEITAVFDDLQNAILMNGAFSRQQTRKDERQPRGYDKNIGSKKFVF